MSGLSAIRQLPANFKSALLISAVGAKLAGAGCTDLEDTDLLDETNSSVKSLDVNSEELASAGDADIEVGKLLQ